jgi:hypothetical protein
VRLEFENGISIMNQFTSLMANKEIKNIAFLEESIIKWISIFFLMEDLRFIA